MCPMHPDITSATPGVCPKCSMKLVLGTPFDMRDYQVEFRTEPALVKPGEKTRLIFKVLHPGTDAPVTTFELVHDKPYHLFVVSQDMAEFQHIHPTFEPDGSFAIETVLPFAGNLLVCIAVSIKGKGPQRVAARTRPNGRFRNR